MLIANIGLENMLLKIGLILKIKADGNREDRFAGAGKVIAGSKVALPKMELDKKGAGGLLGDKKQN